MTNPPPLIRMGLVGANAARGWGGIAHVPALKAVTALTLQAVATRDPSSANEAAAAFGAPLAFSDPGEMIAHAEIDAVAVAVKAPAHFKLVEQALRLRKPVYCEWPLGGSLEETRSLAHLAAQNRVVTAVGLQGRCSPWVEQIRRLVLGGRLGRILSTTLVAYDEFSVGSVEAGNAYMLDAANGANPLTIHAGHFIDLLCFVLGELKGLSAVLATGRPSIAVRETGEMLTSTSPDQTAVCGLLDGGIVASIHIRAGKGDPSVRWEIQGEDAVLRVTADGYLHWQPLTLEVWDGRTWHRISPPDLSEGWRGVRIAPGPAQNLAYAYAAFAEDIQTGSNRSASFGDALARHKTLDAIEASARGVASSRLAPVSG